MTAADLLQLGRIVPLPVHAPRVVERSIRVYRRSWMVFLTGLLEPFFYLTGIGFGVGSLVGAVHFGGRTLPYAVFVAPALMASAAMNGAFYDSTFGLFFKLRVAHTFEAMLATPVGVMDIAAGEVLWALARGAIYATAFLLVMLGFGLVGSPWAVLAVPGSVLIGFAFASLGCASTSFARNWQDFDVILLAQMPIFLFSATFYPVTIYPGPIRILAELSPLTRGVDLLRGLTTGMLDPLMILDAAYLAALGVLGIVITSRRLGRVLLM
jgi:lipooligosaccharide transport system permease protein